MSAQDRLRRRQEQKVRAQRRQAEFDAEAERREAEAEAAYEARRAREMGLPGPTLEALDAASELREDVEDPTVIDYSGFDYGEEH